MSRLLIAVSVSVAFVINLTARAQADTKIFTSADPPEERHIACEEYVYEGWDIVVENCTVTIDCEHSFNSFQIINGGVVRHSSGGAIPPGETDPVGMHLIIAGDLTIEAGSSIIADGYGYAANSGPGGGSCGSLACSGAGYGGRGGDDAYDGSSGGSPGVCYGSVFAPVDFGSGGGGAGRGGGAIHLSVSGALLVDGTIRADGATGDSGGGGSGGSVYLQTSVFSGASSGRLHANGANTSGGSSAYKNGGGGGGRIAIYCDARTFEGTISASGGQGGSSAEHGGAGTIYTRDSGAPLGLLLIDNGGTSGARTEWTEPVPTDLDCDVRVTGRARLSPRLLEPLVLNIAGGLTVELDGVVTAGGYGHPTDTGPGHGLSGDLGWCGGGGGYGGGGGNGRYNAYGGPMYNPYPFDPANLGEPHNYGSGGATGYGYQSGGGGGGSIRLYIEDFLQVDGLVSSGGASGSASGGGGSGGLIEIRVANGPVTGAGAIRANGGNSPQNGGGGGGGHIIVATPCKQFDPIPNDPNQAPPLVQLYGGSGFQAGGPGQWYAEDSVTDPNNAPNCDGVGEPDACVIANCVGDPLCSDCNRNNVPDGCDIDSAMSDDCNANGVPDECESDCNTNGVADECDITDGTSLDCNVTGVPDECESIGGGDFDANGVVNYVDFAAFVECLAGPDLPPTPPAPECIDACLRAFDDEDDDDIDLADFAILQMLFTGAE